MLDTVQIAAFSVVCAVEHWTGLQIYVTGIEDYCDVLFTLLVDDTDVL